MPAPDNYGGFHLDAHVHVFDEAVLANLQPIAAKSELTHFVAIVDDPGLVDRLPSAGARGLPFQWVHDLAQPALADWAAGCKVHPREPLLTGRSFSVSPESFQPICELAGRLGRPILVHTDADEPETCTLPQLAQVARRFSQANLIAAHAGVFAGPYFEVSRGREYDRRDWPQVALAAWRQNLALLMDVPNLYADTTLLGLDDPSRSDDPDQRQRLFAAALAELSPAQRRRLLDKIFIGTDFPCFWQAADGRGAYPEQARRLAELFGPDFDEDALARRFLKLLPDESALRP